MREVTVATPTDRVSAELAVSLLHSMKVPARIVSNIEPVWTMGSTRGTIIDLRIVVPEDRAVEARELLGEPPRRQHAERSVAIDALIIVILVTSSVVAAALLISSR